MGAGKENGKLSPFSKETIEGRWEGEVGEGKGRFERCSCETLTAVLSDDDAG